MRNELQEVLTPECGTTVDFGMRHPVDQLVENVPVYHVFDDGSTSTRD